jgi:hypothetical protein
VADDFYSSDKVLDDAGSENPRAESPSEDASDKDSAPTKPKRDPEKTLSQAKRRFKLCEEAEAENRKASREDYEFRAGKQWKDQDIADRSVDGRPCLVINRIPQFIHQVTNDQRQNRPSIKVHPVDDKGDPDTAEIIQGLVRHIEERSSADTAYDTATDGAATGGFGFFRILTEYASHKSFDQELRIKRLRNPFAAYLDHSHQEPDGSDANYGFTWDDLQEDEYRAQFPDSKLAGSRDWESLGATTPGWLTGKSARVLEYFDRCMEPDTLYGLSNGNVALKSELTLTPLPEGVEIVSERPTKVPKVYWYKINGVEILDETIWVSRWIPIIPVYGDEYVDPSTGRVIREGIVRNAKDSQRMYNYWTSAETETIALAPRAPFIGAEGQFAGHEEKWKSANRRSHAYLEFKPVSLMGQMAPAPQRQPFEPPVQAITNAKAMAADDMKATTGIYDAALGARSNENSGVAIQRRNVQSQTSNFHIVDNLTKSIRHAGRILVDAIPKVYDSARAARIIGDEGGQKIVKLNQAFMEDGKPVLYDMTVGEYDVAVDVGPSFATKRQEAAASMMDLTKSVPVIGQAAPDLIVKNMDWPGAQEIADRIRRTLPPGLADDPKNQQPLPPEVQNKMQQMGHMIEQLSKQLHDAHDLIDTKKVELDSRERIEMWKIQADLEKTLATVSSKEAVALLEQQIGQIQHQLNTFVAPHVAAAADPSQFPPQPQDDNFGSGAAGDMSAAQPESPTPTGGEPPGTPMEP